MIWQEDVKDVKNVKNCQNIEKNMKIYINIVIILNA